MTEDEFVDKYFINPVYDADYQSEIRRKALIVFHEMRSVGNTMPDSIEIPFAKMVALLSQVQNKICHHVNDLADILMQLWEWPFPENDWSAEAQHRKNLQQIVLLTARILEKRGWIEPDLQQWEISLGPNYTEIWNQPNADVEPNLPALQPDPTPKFRLNDVWKSKAGTIKRAQLVKNLIKVGWSYRTIQEWLSKCAAPRARSIEKIAFTEHFASKFRS